MSSILKIICGSIVRHWATALLAMVGVRIGLSADDAHAAVANISNDLVYNLLLALFAAVPSAAWAILTRLRSKLKQRLALMMPACSSEKQMKAVIADAPIGARIAATLTTNPDKLDV